MPEEEEHFDGPYDYMPDMNIGGEKVEQDWLNELAVSKAMLTPESTSTEYKVTFPRFTKKWVAVVIRDKKGEPIRLTEDNQLLYDVQEHEVFDGYDTKTITLPGQEMFNVDLVSSYLSERDVPAIRAAGALYADLQLQTLRGKDRSEDMHWLYTRMMQVINTAKSKNGKMAELSKTTIARGHSEQEIIQRVKAEEKSMSWIPGRR